MGKFVNRYKLYLPLVAFAALAVLLFRGLSLDPTALPSALVDQPMPNFSLADLNTGELITENALKGQTSLVNVWATWCYSCRVEHPYLLELAERGVPIVGLNYKDKASSAKKWLQDLRDPYVFTISDPNGTLGLDLGVYGAPETYVVDSEGFIRYRHVGVVDELVWSRDLARYFDPSALATTKTERAKGSPL